MWRGVDRKGRFAVVRIPAHGSCRKFLDHTHEWLKKHMHLPRRVQQAYLATMLRGFYQYFALHHCEHRLDWIRHEVQLQWVRTLVDAASGTGCFGAISRAARGLSCRVRRLCIRRSEEAET